MAEVGHRGVRSTLLHQGAYRAYCTWFHYTSFSQRAMSVGVYSWLTCMVLQVVSPESLVGYMEQPKASNITKVFEDAYKSPLSIVILVSSSHTRTCSPAKQSW